MHYKLNVAGIATGAVANTFISLLGMKLADTVGHRARLRKLVVGGGGDAAQDIQVSLRLRRTDNTTDGTKTDVNVNTIGQADPASRASVVSAIGKNYTDEPTTFETGTLGLAPLNARATLVQEWGPDEAPCWGPDQTLVLEGAPGTAVAVNLEVTAEWEEY